METYIALLRGINVGGKNIVRMAELRECLAEAGLTNVRTYIQSGNVVFAHQKTGADALATTIRDAVHKRKGFSPTTLVLTRLELASAVADLPLQKAPIDDKSTHLYFLTEAPSQQALEKLRELATDSERCELNDRVLYLFAPDGIARSKLAAKVEKVLSVSATARNLRSARKILDLAE